MEQTKYLIKFLQLANDFIFENDIFDVISNYNEEDSITQQISDSLNLKESIVPTEMINQKQECIICLVEFTERTKIISLDCKHIYHSHCLKIWLSLRNKICPTCKRNI